MRFRARRTWRRCSPACKQNGVQALFRLGSEEDYKDARRMIATVAQPRLGLPEKGYYLRSDAKSVTLRKQYVSHIAHMLTLAGEPAEQAAADADRVLAIETKLATASLSQEELRDPSKLYHPTELVSFHTQLGAFDLDTYLRTLGTPAFTMLNVSTPAYFDALNKVLPQTDAASLKALLRWNLLHSTPGTALPAALDSEQFAFYGKTLRGQPEQQVRWKRCVTAVDGFSRRSAGPCLCSQTVQFRGQGTYHDHHERYRGSHGPRYPATGLDERAYQGQG